MGDAAKRHEQAAVLRRLADRLEKDGAELPDAVMMLLAAPVGPPATQEELDALARAQKAWAEERDTFLTLDEAERLFEAREKR
jgi:hypothetical protein